MSDYLPTGYVVFLFLLLAAACDRRSTGEGVNDYLRLSLKERQRPENAVQAFEVAEGLDIQLFAAEPMVINPTNMAIDERGRVWVCESYNYAVAEEDRREPGGRITILEDTDGDGAADKRTVFYQGEDVHLALGIGIFGERIFVARSPDMLVFTDADGDDRPDSKEVLFSGMGGPGDHSAHAVVFGPDGRFYFNYGNAGKRVLSPAGDPLRDRSGRAVVSDGDPYHGGMVFRFDQDGGNFEVLGHNFRNNYEVTIDAFGNLWQSDNDDDGNQSVRINYVMEYGNYGYLDELTGAHWAAPRTGMHEQIPYRHWHQHDPGVVPNLLHTGAGSPAGITIYEGTLLPPPFRGQLIHADAGPNVVRAYPVRVDGAGFTARSLDLVRGAHDQWFRPVDVDIAPDGSLFVADWYDPIAGDHEKGRIFRIAPPGAAYRVVASGSSSDEEAVQALGNPNAAVRYAAWQQLRERGREAEAVLARQWRDGSPRARARALWLLGQLDEADAGYIAEAAADEDAQLRVVAIRLARQRGMALSSFLAPMTDDPSPMVRREAAIALRYEDDPSAAALWTALARRHDGADRWYLEALGIGADRHWERFFDSWLATVGPQWNSPAGKDIVWRSRAPAALPLLAELILAPDTPEAERLRYFRAFDFHTHPSKTTVLLRLIDEADRSDRSAIRALALQHLPTEGLVRTPELSAAIERTLDDLVGTWQYVELIDKFKLTGKRAELLELATQARENDAGSIAARLLVTSPAFAGLPLMEERIYSDEEAGEGLLVALRSVGEGEVLRSLQMMVLDEGLPLALRREAIRTLGSTWPGESALLEAVKDSTFPETLKPLAASILFSVYRTSIHEEAAQHLDRPRGADREGLPPIRVLAATEGNAERGAALFQTYCQSCHQVNGAGISFGPELSLIGDKLSKEGLYRAIIYPNEGINYNYETYQLTLRSGDMAVGLLASETAGQIDLKIAGGAIQSYPKSVIEQTEMLPNSLMPNLSLSMEMEELVDLVSYLTSLRQPM